MKWAKPAKRLRSRGAGALAAAICGCAGDPEDVPAAGEGRHAGDRFQAALEIIHRGELDSGAVALRQVLRADTAHYEARLGLREILMRQRKLPEALHQLERAVGHEPGRPEARIQQARVLILLDRRPEARVVLAALVGDFPDRARPRMMLADLLMTRAPPDPQGALEQYEAVLGNNPGDSRARAGAAASRLRLGDFERAAAEMSGLLAASPRKTHLAFLLGTAHHWLGEYEAAIAAYRKALDSTPKGAREPQRMKWNLRLAYLGLHGHYPGDLPAGYRLPVADLGEESPVAFRDVAEAVGVAKRDRGRGNAWGDFDGDGDLDLFSTGIQVPHSLYRNESGAQFTDVTAAAGLGDPRGGWSATAVDCDNDGDLDLYATRDAWEGKAPNSLYRNLGGLRFGEAGVGDPDDSFTAAWGDVDNDGWVDLYVAEGITGGGTRNKLFVNLGGRFENRRDRLGVAHPGKSLGVAFGDYDRDGDVDLYLAKRRPGHAAVRAQHTLPQPRGALCRRHRSGRGRQSGQGPRGDVRRLRRRRRSRPLRRHRRALAGRPVAQQPLPQRGAGIALARCRAGGIAVESQRHRGPGDGPCRRAAAARRGRQRRRFRHHQQPAAGVRPWF